MEKFIRRTPPAWKPTTSSQMQLFAQKENKKPGASMQVNKSEAHLIRLLTQVPDEPLILSPTPTTTTTKCSETQKSDSSLDSDFVSLTLTTTLNKFTPKTTSRLQNEELSNASDYIAGTPNENLIIKNCNMEQPANPGNGDGVPPTHRVGNAVEQIKNKAMLERLNRDLNSPSASARLRALKALKDPENCAYNHFDVSHSEQDIITEEERNYRPTPLVELMKTVIAYVEVRSGCEDRSEGIKKFIAALGANINDTLKRNTTHVIFKDGRPSTYKKAKQWGIPIVSIMWIEACKTLNVLCDPAKYPIVNLIHYEEPEVYGKIKRTNFLQTGIEVDKRIRPKNPTKTGTPKNGNATKTPKSAKTPTPVQNRTKNISDFFKPMSKTTARMLEKGIKPSKGVQIIDASKAMSSSTPNRTKTAQKPKKSLARPYAPLPKTFSENSKGARLTAGVSANAKMSLKKNHALKAPAPRGPQLKSDAKKSLNFNDDSPQQSAKNGQQQNTAAPEGSATSKDISKTDDNTDKYYDYLNVGKTSKNGSLAKSPNTVNEVEKNSEADNAGMKHDKNVNDKQNVQSSVGGTVKSLMTDFCNSVQSFIKVPQVNLLQPVQQSVVNNIIVNNNSEDAGNENIESNQPNSGGDNSSNELTLDQASKTDAEQESVSISISVSEGAVSNNTRASTRRRRTLFQMPNKISPIARHNVSPPKKLQSRRRTLCQNKTQTTELSAQMQITSNTTLTNAPDKTQETHKVVEVVSSLQFTPVERTLRRRTIYTNNTIELSQFESKNYEELQSTPVINKNRRRTLYTPRRMEEETVIEAQPLVKSFTKQKDLRRTVLTPQPMLEATVNENESATAVAATGEKSASDVQMSLVKKPSRRTLYTPQRMVESRTEITKAAPQKSMDDQLTLSIDELTLTPSRCAMMDDRALNMLHVIENVTPQAGGTNPILCSTIQTNEDSYTTPRAQTKETLLEQYTKSTTSVFSATRKPANRRTLYDVKMDILTQRVENLNKSISRMNGGEDNNENIVDSSFQAKQKENCVTEQSSNTSESGNGISSEDSADAASTNAIPSMPVVRKRKLFVPNSYNFPPTPKLPSTPTVASRKSISNVPAASSSHVLDTPSKRRRTMAPLVPIIAPQAENNNAGIVQEKIQEQSNVDTVPEMNAALVTKSSTKRNSRRSTLDFATVRKFPKPVALTKGGKSNVYSAEPARDNIMLVYTNMHKEQIQILKEAVIKLGGCRLENDVSEATTHCISFEPRRTLNLLRALARGVWILKFNWITSSMNAGRWLNEEEYELDDFSRAVKICRAERQAFGPKYKCELFVNLGNFYVSSRNGLTNKRNIEELIALCGGKVVHNRTQARYILSGVAPKTNDGKIHVSPFWIFDSITQMQLLRIHRYTPFSDGPGSKMDLVTKTASQSRLLQSQPQQEELQAMQKYSY